MWLILLFWLSLLGVFYTYAGYPVLLRMLNTLRKPKAIGSSQDESGELPSVSIILVVWNAGDSLVRRLTNLSDCHYRGDREIVVVCDGCDDNTVEIARGFEGAVPIRVVEQEVRSGKASGLNQGVENAKGDILVFADLRQRFDENAIQRLVLSLQGDSQVAAVSGNLEIERSEDGAGAGIDAYWRLEKWIRQEEARRDSVIGCTGAIYALRRSAYTAIPEDTLIDDVVIPMHALVKGGRILFEPQAIAFDPQTLNPETEARRKIRTLAGNYQMLFRYPSWLVPWGNRCWWNLISHKYLRLVGAVFLAVCFISSFLLARESIFFQIALGMQVACYSLALIGIVWKSCRFKLCTIPAGFVFLQWQSIRAFAFYLKNCRTERSGVWES
ncbi:MAG: glycosyltransferase family 2 protein [Verrucomicrobiales bacterium]|nr:glycosyltransferase family 2 protein [Verrucomicrobiales bacterium]